MDAVSSRVLLGASGSVNQPWGAVIIRETVNASCWTGTQFFAAAERGKILTSADGAFWTVTQHPSTSSFLGVAGNNTTLVAVRNAGVISTASAGVERTWVSRTSGTSQQLDSVVWSGSQFVVAGATGTILTSPDGETWTTRTSGVTTNLRAITWDGTQFVVVGSSSTVLTSPDGVTWTQRSIGVSTVSFLGVAGSGSLFAAVGQSTSTGLAVIYTSADGVTWTERTAPSGLAALGAIVWTGLRFVSFNTASAGLYTYSSDGVTWPLNVTFDTGTPRTIAWSGSVLATLGRDGVVATSPTGIDPFTRRNTIPDDFAPNFTCIAWGAGTFVVGSDGNRDYLTSDGLTWSALTIDDEANNRRGIVWSGTQFVAVGEAGTIQTSPDGTTWTPRVTATGQILNAVAWSGSTFAAAGGDTAGHIRTSPDGITWTTRTSNSTSILRCVTWGNGLFVAAGDAGKLVTSPTGATWTARTSGTVDNILGVAYGAGVFVAVTSGADGSARVLTSTNGTSWTTTATLANVYLNAVLWTGLQFIAVGRNGPFPFAAAVFTSQSGLNWSTVPALFTGNPLADTTGELRAVASNIGRSIAVGLKSEVYMSPRPATPPYPTV